MFPTLDLRRLRVLARRAARHPRAAPPTLGRGKCQDFTQKQWRIKIHWTLQNGWWNQHEPINWRSLEIIGVQVQLSRYTAIITMAISQLMVAMTIQQDPMVCQQSYNGDRNSKRILWHVQTPAQRQCFCILGRGTSNPKTLKPWT